MNKVVINILRRAEEDMEDIYHYIANELQSPQVAMKQFNSIAEAIQTLEVYPERSAIVEELLVLGIKVRRLLMKNYSIFYRFDNDIVTVLRVLHQSRSLDKLMFKIGQKEDW
ncbi:type II toxin-antitoxin system RelE/ParE family toxin [Streptococcus didelphis]|uniref:Type II toxin-antitoxin system RelE/ParE family toxin n=1 Tax=Streptococcus didelphis TaxID=102886 RepID=A0ABY9LGP5_9STRE|nr:type II toxin-antitoxin system RelE/ParE family toxin [Streptococcus didelphis]WMB27928.1 type II toxin-antitoxin system RelE/ParE family toxin [Streptococcus didelphis]WMB29605.1 type II toxin-antitoxin system RelE/ParE family toxin [Streptococcus didelphis]